MEKVRRRKFVATAAVAGAAAVLRPPAFAFDNQGAGAVTAVAGPVDHEVIAPQASPFPMKNVRLQPGAFPAAAEANRKYLKTLPPDRLLHTFRLTAGLPSSAEPLGEWEKPDCELRGHFAGGHYLRCRTRKRSAMPGSRIRRQSCSTVQAYQPLLSERIPGRD